QGAQHLAGQPDRSVQARPWRVHRVDRGCFPQGYRGCRRKHPAALSALVLTGGGPCSQSGVRRMSSAPALLSVQGLTKSYGGVPAVRGVSFELERGEILALIGPNGAGKSTCFDMLNGQRTPDSGRIMLLGEDTTGRAPREVWRLGVGRTFQITATFPTMTVCE